MKSKHTKPYAELERDLLTRLAERTVTDLTSPDEHFEAAQRRLAQVRGDDPGSWIRGAPFQVVALLRRCFRALELWHRAVPDAARLDIFGVSEAWNSDRADIAEIRRVLGLERAMVEPPAAPAASTEAKPDEPAREP